MNPSPAWKRSDFRVLGLVTVVAGFMALIWLDSAAFLIVQGTPDLQQMAWGSRGWLLGGVHLLAAVGAGWALDRGRSRSLMLATFALFVAAFELLASGGAASPLSGPLYVTGISIYSVVLVGYPSAWPDRAGIERIVPGRWRAALLYGIAGWVGSAMGIGMAEDLNTIPRPFVVVAGVVLGSGWLISATSSSSPAGRALKAHRITLLMGLVGILWYGAISTREPVAVEPGATRGSGVYATAAERGRAVYIAEGCINCHSQFVRPATADVARFGPPDPDAARARPVLIGNRRQGPDLLNVGLRYTSGWHRQHLIDPRSMTPGSRMPSYAHLFRDGDPRGEELVAYLDSLGRQTTQARVHASEPGR